MYIKVFVYTYKIQFVARHKYTETFGDMYIENKANNENNIHILYIQKERNVTDSRIDYK